MVIEKKVYLEKNSQH